MPAYSAWPSAKTRLRRCRHCRQVWYCSAACAAAHSASHAAEHRRRHVTFPPHCGRPDYANDLDFAPFEPFK